MAIKVYPYKQGSRSARALADALGGRVLRIEGSRYQPRRGDVVINWGSSSFPFGDDQVRCFNDFGTDVASNKLQAFEKMRQSGVSIPEFWTSQNDTPDDAFPVVCRTILNGHSGAGIHIAETREELVNAPLYVRYIKKQDEYRVHVFQGRVIAVQRKARRHDCENPNWRVRNHVNGFIYSRIDVNPPAGVLVEAISALASLHLDFGGVDVIFNNHSEQGYVLECNTACGLEGQTVEDYANAIVAAIR